MNEDNKIRSFTWIAISLIVIALWFTVVFACCCTPPKQLAQSTQEYKEARIISAEIKLIEPVKRADSKGYYYTISRVYWEAENVKWYTYSDWPCHYWVGFRMPLLTKR